MAVFDAVVLAKGVILLYRSAAALRPRPPSWELLRHSTAAAPPPDHAGDVWWPKPFRPAWARHRSWRRAWVTHRDRLFFLDGVWFFIGKIQPVGVIISLGLYGKQQIS